MYIVGIESVAFIGKHKDQVEIVGVGLDWDNLSRKMRKEIRAETELLWLKEIDGSGSGAAEAAAS